MSDCINVWFYIPNFDRSCQIPTVRSKFNKSGKLIMYNIKGKVAHSVLIGDLTCEYEITISDDIMEKYMKPLDIRPEYVNIICLLLCAAEIRQGIVCSKSGVIEFQNEIDLLFIPVRLYWRRLEK